LAADGIPDRYAVARERPAGTPREPGPKYRSKKNPKLKWTGRGVRPLWMREEMNGKDDFLIK